MGSRWLKSTARRGQRVRREPDRSGSEGLPPWLRYKLPPQNPDSQDICQAFFLLLFSVLFAGVWCVQAAWRLGVCRSTAGGSTGRCPSGWGQSRGKAKPFADTPCPPAWQRDGWWAPAALPWCCLPSPSPQRTGRCVMRCKQSHVRAAGAKALLRLPGAGGVFNPHPPWLPTLAPLCGQRTARRVPVQAEETESDVSGSRLPTLLELFKTSEHLHREGCVAAAATSRGCQELGCRGLGGLPWKEEICAAKPGKGRSRTACCCEQYTHPQERPRADSREPFGCCDPERLSSGDGGSHELRVHPLALGSPRSLLWQRQPFDTVREFSEASLSLFLHLPQCHGGNNFILGGCLPCWPGNS